MNATPTLHLMVGLPGVLEPFRMHRRSTAPSVLRNALRLRSRPVGQGCESAQRRLICGWPPGAEQDAKDRRTQKPC